MFLLDSLMISGIRWVMNTVITSAEAEMNDDTALREQLLEAEMRREMGEISDDQFGELEADLLGRIREIKHRREGGSGPLQVGGAEAVEKTADTKFQVEASVSGDFYDPADAPHTTIVDSEPRYGEHIELLDMQPGAAAPQSNSALPLTAEHQAGAGTSTRPRAKKRTSTATTRTVRTKKTAGSSRTARTTQTSRTSKISE